MITLSNLLLFSFLLFKSQFTLYYPLLFLQDGTSAKLMSKMHSFMEHTMKMCICLNPQDLFIHNFRIMCANCAMLYMNSNKPYGRGIHG
jgi:hypothetical protein